MIIVINVFMIMRVLIYEAVRSVQLVSLLEGFEFLMRSVRNSRSLFFMNS